MHPNNKNDIAANYVAKILSPILMALLMVLLMVPPSYAQITDGHVTGTIKDATGAIIPGAQVTLINEGTKEASHVESTSTGTYVFDLVKPGTYTIQVEMAGFKKGITPGIQVHIQESVKQDYALTIGSETEQITVNAENPLLQTGDASLGTTVSTQQINDLPLVGRDWTTLAHLAAGTTTTGGGAASSSQFSANGVNFNQNDSRLDGIDDNLEFYGSGGSISIQAQTSIVPPPDALEEFHLQTGDYSAELGHSTGSVINAVIKSGTDKFTGDLWEYNRNTIFNANDYFSNQQGASRSAYHQNQFGGSIGGPVRLPWTHRGVPRTFFFFDTQRNSAITPNDISQTVPTLAMQQSNFTDMQTLITMNSGSRTDALGRTFSTGTILDPSTTRLIPAGQADPISGIPNTTGGAIYVRDPFYSGGSIAGIKDFTTLTSSLNQIPANRLDPNAIKLMNLYPLPNAIPNDPGTWFNNFRYYPSTILNLNQYDVRIDHNFNDSNLLWGVFNWYHAMQQNPQNLPGLASGNNYGAGNSDSPHYAIALSYTHIFSPTLSNSLHAGLQKSVDNIDSPFGNTAGIPEQYGIQGVPNYPGNGGLPPISFSNFSALGDSGYNPVRRGIHSIEVMENLNKVYRNHDFSIGFESTSIEANIQQPTNSKGYLNNFAGFSDIPNNASGYDSMADLLLIPEKYSLPAGQGVDNVGGVGSYGESNSNYVDYHKWYNAGYFQDNWKVLPTLTLNLGLRYDYYGAPIETNDRQANMIAGGAGDGPGGTFYMINSTCQQATSAFVALLSKDDIQQTCVSNRGLSQTQKYNFAPRLGFAYEIKPNLMVRGGYGITYGALDNIGAAPWVIGYNFPFVYSVGFSAPNSVTPLTLSNGQLPTFENVLATLNLTTPALTNPEGLNLAGRQWKFQTPYTETFNLTVQRQLGKHDSVQAAYVGVLGRHLDNRGTYNTPSEILPPGTDNYNYIPFPDFAIGSAYLSTNAVSSYNSLQTTYSHQASAGLFVMANYTYSKCMTNQAAFGDGVGYRAQWLPGFGIGREWTTCPNDTTHVVHGSGSYDLPVGKGREFLASSNRLVQGVLGGWSINGIFTYQSGQPFTVGCPISTTSDFGCNANLVPGVNPYAANRGIDHWLNPNAFTNPPVATQIGQADFAPLGGSANQVRGPGFYNIDSSLFKNFPVKDSVYLQFRAEQYNLLNHPQFGNPGNLDFTNPTSFASISGLRDGPRVMQLALKLFY